MRSAAEEVIDADIQAVRRDQDSAFSRLGGQAPSLEQQRLMADDARRVEHLYADLEMTLPEPGPAERPSEYKVRLLAPLQKFSSFRSSDLPQLAFRGALKGIDDAIIREATARAADRTQGSFRRPGRLREIKRGVVTEFAGKTPLTWMSAFMPPVCLAVEGFSGAGHPSRPRS